MYNNNEFINWLTGSKGMQVKSARDVRSRLRRIDIDIGIPEVIDDKFIIALDNNNVFHNYPTYVKSQVRRALRLYIEYLDL